jgi:hypothetical protein
MNLFNDQRAHLEMLQPAAGDRFSGMFPASDHIQ